MTNRHRDTKFPQTSYPSTLNSGVKNNVVNLKTPCPGLYTFRHDLPKLAQ